MDATYHIGSDSYGGTIKISKSGKRATFTRGHGEPTKLYLDQRGTWRVLKSGGHGYVRIGQATTDLDPHF